MVTKKYLCNAPRQEVWDEKVEAMLKSLRGTEKQKRRYIRKTLQGLQEEHGHEKRSGPGRKSNAYYALTYFEYALSKVGGSLEDTDSGSSSSSSESEEEEDLHSSSASNKKGKSKSQEAEEEKTIESMDSQEFLNEHNDLCDVCNEGGNLLCCSTCNLVFHLGCLRPAMAELPQGDWSCPYCVLSGTPVAIPEKRGKQTVKRSSKMWKAAAVGVRQMGRLRALANSKGGKKESSSSKTSGGTAQGGNNTKEGHAGNNNNNKNSPMIETPAKTMEDPDSAKTPPDLTITPPLRGKRSRRQVTLYDPQDGPASEWRSDEKFAAKKEEEEKQDSNNNINIINPNVEPMARKKRRMARKKQEEEAEGGEESSQEEEEDDGSTASAFCKFCNDDKEIPLCVFCGCRVCFGKKDKQKLLLCDGCDEEYHTYCLDPPLTSAPKASTSWYCPSCIKEKTTTRVHKTRRSSGATAKAAAVATSPPTRTTTPKSASKPTSKPTSTGRPRGRPPKNPPAAAASTTTPTPKRRGRPPKSATKAAQAAAETPAPRKRGRPPKNASATPASSDSSSSKRKQSPGSGGSASGSSSKKARTAASTAASSSPIISAARKVTTLPSVAAATDNVSRSGRILKATSKQQARADQHSVKGGTEEATIGSSVTKVSSEAAKKSSTPVAAQPKQAPPKTKQPLATSAKKPVPRPLTTQSTVQRAAASATTTNKMAAAQPTKAPSAVVRLQQGTAKPPVASIPAGQKSAPKPAVPTGVKQPGTLVPTAKKVAPGAAPANLSAAPGSLPSKVATAPTAASGLQATNKPPTATVAKKPTAPSTIAAKKKVPTISVTTREPQGKLEIPVAPIVAAVKKVAAANPRSKLDVPTLVAKAIRQSAAAARADVEEEEKPSVAPAKAPRRKPGARECMQISRRFGLRVIPQKYMETLLDYCTRGKVEHLIRMRERLDEHSRFLEAQLAGLEAVIREVGESDVVVPALPDRPDNKPHNAPASR